MFPIQRPRRLRRTAGLRRLVRETRVDGSDLVWPVFVAPGEGRQEPIGSMPGNFHWSVDRLVDEAGAAHEEGVAGILLFGIPEGKDALGSAAWDDEAPVQQAVRALKAAVPDLRRVFEREKIRIQNALREAAASN